MTEVEDETVLNALRNLEEKVCFIEAGDCYGTGFHFGNGWVMSVAHNFQADKDPESFHSLVNKATFTFPNGLIFGQAHRLAFVHHLKTGDRVDQRKDIAMVKLGAQYEYGRGGIYEEWENRERELLTGLGNFADITERAPVRGNTVYSIHHGGGEGVKFNQHTIRAMKQILDLNYTDISTIDINPTLQHGASGCPILDNEYRLVGLFFCGGKYRDLHAVDTALAWRGVIFPYVNEGVRIITEVDEYMMHLQQAENKRTVVQSSAESGNLTVYLPNGEVINAENSTGCRLKCVVL